MNHCSVRSSIVRSFIHAVTPPLPAVFLLIFFALHAPFAGAQLLSNEREVSYPARGTYNGYNDHSNILECSNYSLDTIRGTVTMFRSSGTTLGQVGFTVRPRSSTHLILTDLFTIRDTYGVFRLDATPSSARSGLRCVTLIYRFPHGPSRIPVTYSLALPVHSPIRGPAGGLFNSLNPLGASALPVHNFLTVVNPGPSAFNASVELYDAAGSFLGTVPVTNLQANQRDDIPLGHPSGKVVGLYRIVPASNNQDYYAYISVYAPAAGDFVYAYALHASRPTCDGEPLFVSTMGPAFSWVQLANPGSGAVSYTLEVRNSVGSIVHSEPKSLAAHAHEHLFVNAFLGDNNLGSVRATCRAGGLLVQGASYGRTGPGGAVAWGYANQIRDLAAGAGELVAQPFNSFLGALSWLRTQTTVPGGGGLVTQVRTSEAEARQLSTFAAFGGSTDLPLFTLASADRIGNVATAPTSAGRPVTSELLRVFPTADGEIGHITLIPPAIVDGEVPQSALSRLAGGLSEPVAMANAGDGTGRLFIVELGGTIRILQNGSLAAAPFLDITSRVLSGGERGLLGLAFHPSYASNGRFYVNYVNRSGNTVIAEYQVSSNANVASAASERILFTVTQPFGNHKGGQLAFGPDGFLYIALGDGGSGGDPGNRAQNLNELLGKILRIDVNGAAPYAVPASNPFVGVNGTRAEIWAYGFRNPWRFSFDRLNGRLFAGDVGQGEREEIDIVARGGNYGWRIMEGNRCFNPEFNCPQGGLVLPIHDYPRSDGIAVIGGYVYRANPTSSLYGKYFFGDFGSSKIWTLEEQPNGSWLRTEILNAGFPISSFGEDEAGELYVLNLDGEIYRLNLS